MTIRTSAAIVIGGVTLLLLGWGTTIPSQPRATLAASTCHPLTNSGNCYEPGEFCRASDHGVTGLAGDGESVRCEDNDGWRWEPV